MPYTADPYDDTKPTGGTLALYLDDEMRATKGAAKGHRDRIVALEDTEATTLAAGIVRLATNAELNTGTDALHPITPAQLAMKLAVDTTGTQYKVVLGGTLSLRFGTITLRNTGVADTPVVFDDPFTGSIKGVLLSRKTTVSGQEGSDLLYMSESVSGFTITHAGIGTTITMSWVAFGTDV